MKMFGPYSSSSENGKIVVRKYGKRWGEYDTMKEAWDDVMEDFRNEPTEEGEL